MNKITSKQLLNSIRLRFQFFPSHLVDRSIWPIYLSFSLFSLAVSAVQYMHGYSTGSILLRASIVLTILGMGLWWKDVIIEASFLGNHTKKVKEGILQGFILFVISEIMVFLSVFWAYAHSSLSPALEIGGCWPKIVLIIFCFYLKNIQWFFWKENQILTASIIASLFSNKTHLSKEGLTQIIDILYSVPNKYTKPKDYWLQLIEKQQFKKSKD